MDRKSILLKLKQLIHSNLGPGEVLMEIEPHDVIRLTVISNVFQSVSLSKRIDKVSYALLDLTTTELVSFDLIIHPLTFDELRNSEQVTHSTKSSNQENLAASSY